MTRLDPDDPRSPYLQVAGRLRDAIASGTNPPGSQLPTYQELADEFGVAVNTAKSAVNLLRDEGLVVVRQGKGSYVRTELEPVGQQDADRDERVWQAIADIRRRLSTIEQRLEQG
jgi:DNA-binding GntR family transcriptional regulator